MRCLRRSLWAWLVAYLSLQAAGVHAGSPAPACPDQPIRVGLYELGPFHSMPRGAKQGAGLDRDIVDELQKRSGCSFTFEPMARARIWIELRAGRLDMTLSALHSDDRASYTWLHPLMQMQSLVLLPRELLPEASSRSAFMAHQGWMLGVVRGYQHPAADQAMIDALRAEQRVLEVVDQPALFAKLRSGQIHAMLSYPMVYRHYLQAEEMQERFATTRWDTEETSSLVNLALSKKTFTADQAQRWRRLTDQISRDGTVERLLQRYVPPVEARSMLLPAPHLARNP